MSDFEKLCDILEVEPEERKELFELIADGEEHLVFWWTADGDIQSWGTV